MNKFEKLLYIDNDFISAAYEEVTGCSPETTLTKTEGMNAGVGIPIFKAGVNSVESKSYDASTIQMYLKIQKNLQERYPLFSKDNYKFGCSSQIVWINGTITIASAKVTTRKSTEKEESLISHEYYFLMKSNDSEFALITTEDYFVSGVSNFEKLARAEILTDMKIPIKALVRVYSAKVTIKNQLATVPMVMYENNAE